MQNIVLLGATGNLGEQALEIIRHYPHLFRVAGVSAHSRESELKKLAEEFECSAVLSDPEQLVEESIDHLVVLDHGLGSLKAVLKALTLKKRVSIANKELLIVHGEEIVCLAQEQKAELIPLDSEHNALFQALRGEKMSEVRRVIITASGGPFRDRSWEDLKNVTVEEVLKHPTWKMGKKTTVDSATLVNKAFEVIETHHLFGLPYEKIEVRLHPQSIIHAVVEFQDGNSKIIASAPDMKIPLAYALFYPERAPESVSAKTPFSYDQPLILEKLEKGRFPCFDYVLELARSSPELLPTIIKNDQQAIDDFIAGKICFTEVYESLRQL